MVYALNLLTKIEARFAIRCNVSFKKERIPCTGGLGWAYKDLCIHKD